MEITRKSYLENLFRVRPIQVVRDFRPDKKYPTKNDIHSDTYQMETIFEFSKSQAPRRTRMTQT